MPFNFLNDLSSRATSALKSVRSTSRGGLKISFQGVAKAQQAVKNLAPSGSPVSILTESSNSIPETSSILPQQGKTHEDVRILSISSEDDDGTNTDSLQPFASNCKGVAPVRSASMSSKPVSSAEDFKIPGVIDEESNDASQETMDRSSQYRRLSRVSKSNDSVGGIALPRRISFQDEDRSEILISTTDQLCSLSLSTSIVNSYSKVSMKAMCASMEVKVITNSELAADYIGAHAVDSDPNLPLMKPMTFDSLPSLQSLEEEDDENEAKPAPRVRSEDLLLDCDYPVNSFSDFGH